LKMLYYDKKRGAVGLRVEDADDLWLLKNIISEGDVVIARTSRDVKLDGQSKRRLPMTLALKVKEVYFQPFATRLRIHGVIIDAPDGYGLKGSHHTFNIDTGSELEVIKKEWSSFQLNRIRKKIKKGVRAILVAADFDEISIAMLYDQGVRYLMDKSLPGVSKESPNAIDNIVKKIAEWIISFIEREKVDLVVIGSPAFLKDLIVKEISNKVKVKIFKDSTSAGGKAGINELLRRDTVKGLLKEISSVQAEEMLSEFMMYLSKNPLMIAYGLNEVKLAVEANAVAKLLVHEELLSSEIRDEIDFLLTKAEERGAIIRIVPTESPASYKLKALGGIIAILRYEFDVHKVAS